MLHFAKLWMMMADDRLLINFIEGVASMYYYTVLFFLTDATRTRLVQSSLHYRLFILPKHYYSEIENLKCTETLI